MVFVSRRVPSGHPIVLVLYSDIISSMDTVETKNMVRTISGYLLRLHNKVFIKRNVRLRLLWRFIEDDYINNTKDLTA